MSDQCGNCTVKGDMEKCRATDCGLHESWFAQTLMAATEYSKKMDGYKERAADPFPFSDQENESYDEARSVHEAYVREHIQAILEEHFAASIAIRLERGGVDYLVSVTVPGSTKEPTNAGWITQEPTEEGWYWVRYKNANNLRNLPTMAPPEIANVSKCDCGGGLAVWAISAKGDPLDRYEWWSRDGNVPLCIEEPGIEEEEMG